jgi:hypothetical protein
VSLKHISNGSVMMDTSYTMRSRGEQRTFMKQKSALKQARWEPPENQVGNKTYPKLRSITTPNKEWYIIDGIAEWIIVQRYGKENVPPRFWTKKGGALRLRTEFQKIKNMMFGMIKRKPGITAFELIIPGWGHFGCMVKHTEYVQVEQVLIESNVENENGDIIADENLINIETKKKPTNVFEATQHLGAADGKTEES